MKIGEKIKCFRLKMDLSHEELANKLNVNSENIRLWETDQTEPSINQLIELSDVFDISMDKLCGKQEKETDKAKSKFTYVFPMFFYVLLNVQLVFSISYSIIDDTGMIRMVLNFIITYVVITLLISYWLKINRVLKSKIILKFFLVVFILDLVTILITLVIKYI